jgi:hypothetical protein
VGIDSHTQNTSRVANDRIHDVLWGVEAEEGSFLCECNRSFCTEEVVMTCAEYVRLRDRGELVYAPGHGAGYELSRPIPVRGEGNSRKL